MCALSELALSCESAYTDIEDGLLEPQPRQSLPPLLFIMLVYTVGIPGIPFSTAALCGWGVLGITLISHLTFWTSQSLGRFTELGSSRTDHWPVLWQQMMRVLLFNIFGTFIGIEQTRQMRLNFWHVRLLQEAVQLHKSCRLRFHRLTANTLPAPIVRAIASRQYNFVKVYENCTLLQADMVGFTPLSSKYPPERVLGILSDIFEEFDELCEQNSVDKVKTIGDAYIVCAGALSEARSDDAERVVRMGMQMQDVVRRIAAKEGVDVAVRIGVHTGRCTGGIIGTVRFHFDMWGNAVYGAVKMEEQGEKGRVHVSDATHALIADRFACTPATGGGCEKQVDESVRDLGITGSFLVGLERPRAAAPPPTKGSPEGEGVRPAARGRRSLIPGGFGMGGMGGMGGGEGATQRRRTVNSGASSALGGTKMADKVKGLRVPHGSGQPKHGGAGTSTKDGDEAPRPHGLFAGMLGSQERNLGGGDGRRSDNEDDQFGGSMANFFVQDGNPLDHHNRAPLGCAASGAAGGAVRQSNALGLSARPRESHAKHEGKAGGAQGGFTNAFGAAGGKRCTVVGIEASSDLAKPPPPPSPMGGGGTVMEEDEDAGGEEEGDGKEAHAAHAAPVVILGDPGRGGEHEQHDAAIGVFDHDAARQQEIALETSNSMVRQLFSEFVLSALRRSSFAIALTLLIFGLYDYFTWQSSAVTAFYLVRGLVCVPAAAIPAMVIGFKRRIKGQELPFINLILLLGPWAATCALVFMAPNRSRQFMLTLAYFQVWMGYTMLSLPTGVLACLQVFLSILYCVAENLVEDFDTLRGLFQQNGVQALCRIPDMSTGIMVVYLVAAHLLGFQHNRRRRRNLRNHAKLLVTQQDRMERITAEVQCCEQLLQNVFPPIVLRRLQDKTQHTGDGTGTFAEKFLNCTFLFAKIVGLQQVTELGESGQADPADVVHALQLIFDRFDALADTFKVQKVRKTVNEYYMVAAGLPDPEVLPNEVERALAMSALAFSMVTVMDVINTEPVIKEITELTGVTLSCQVGIHSGDAIAGVIGKKRFQYDLCGDAVNTAARMCSYSSPGCITVSPTTLRLVQGHYGALYRGEKAVKGKGNMKLFFLTGRLYDGMRELLPKEVKIPQFNHPAAAAAAAAATAAAAAFSRTPSGASLPPPVAPNVAAATKPESIREGDEANAEASSELKPGAGRAGWLQGALGEIGRRLSTGAGEGAGEGPSSSPPSDSAAMSGTAAKGETPPAAGRAASNVAPYLTGGTYNLRLSVNGLPPGQFPDEEEAGEEAPALVPGGAGGEAPALVPTTSSCQTLSSCDSHRWEEVADPPASTSTPSAAPAAPSAPDGSRAPPPPMLAASSSGLRVDCSSGSSPSPSPGAILHDTRPPPSREPSGVGGSPAAATPPQGTPSTPTAPAIAAAMATMRTPASASSLGSGASGAGGYDTIRPFDPPPAGPQSRNASITLDDLKQMEAEREDPTARALARAKRPSRSTLKLSLRNSLTGSLRASLTGGSDAGLHRQNSLQQRQWDTNSLKVAQRAAAMGGDIDTMLAELDGEGTRGERRRSARPSRLSRASRASRASGTGMDDGYEGISPPPSGISPGPSELESIQVDVPSAPPSLPPTPPSRGATPPEVLSTRDSLESNDSGCDTSPTAHTPMSEQWQGRSASRSGSNLCSTQL